MSRQVLRGRGNLPPACGLSLERGADAVGEQRSFYELAAWRDEHGRAGLLARVAWDELQVQVVDASIAHRVEVDLLRPQAGLERLDQTHAEREKRSRFFLGQLRDVLAVWLVDDDGVPLGTGIGFQYDFGAFVFVDDVFIAEERAARLNVVALIADALFT